jgi:adenine-specific DNA-methyltransferase
MASRGKQGKQIDVESLVHDATRVNIPTAETSDFMTDEQKAGEVKTYQRYRRDPVLDPQLVWQGKDEEDADDLQVLVRPIYVQEKIHPIAIIENVRALSQEGMPLQLELFSDFNGIPFEDAVDFYQHEQHWTNRMILGDSLVVMASLAEKENLRGKIQMIYLDPPYGIKFNSNWQPSTLKREVKDGKDVSYEPEQIRAFRDTWSDGIHSYLSYLRNRLRISRELLNESGSIFVQIGDENVHRVRVLLDEVFGDDNFISLITYQKSGSTSSELLSNPADYIIWYAKNRETVKYHQLYQDKEVGGQGSGKYTYAELADGIRLPLSNIPSNLEQNEYRVFRLDSITSQGFRTNTSVPFTFRGQVFDTGSSKNWKTTIEGMQRLVKANRVEDSEKSLNYIRFIDDFPVFALTSIWTDVGGVQSRNDPKIYVVQTSTTAIQRCLLMTTDPGDIVLDPTCGGGTTAYVAEQWGRRWITIDTSRVALALARTRLMSARFPSYRLRDPNNINADFVYKTVPHIKLGSIANIEQIDIIHDKYQPTLDEIRSAFIALMGETVEEWDMPREVSRSDEANELLAEWWYLRSERQKEIDEAIAANAETESLYDQPEIKPKTVRVTGPFTVESLSPHRSLGSDVLNRRTQENIDATNGSRFALDMLEQLRSSGITNTRKGERIHFSELDLYPGKYIHASGISEQAEQPTRVAVHIGPQYGTVSREMIKEAALEAVRGQGFNMLVVCGFAFDPSVGEETKNYGKLTVQTARINPDLLLMGKDLKKDGKGNLFTVFGEPDVDVVYQEDGRIIAKLAGVDIYDPNTGTTRSSSTNEIACWFIDTAYNDVSFFVRHAYFCGDSKDSPYDKLRLALKAEINPGAWKFLHNDFSIPFERPERGKIAVKVINHHGDEVMKVLEV